MPLCSGTPCVTCCRNPLQSATGRQSGRVTSEWVARGSFPEKGCPLAKRGIVRGQPGCVPRDYTLTSCLVCVNLQRSDRKKKYLWHWDDTLVGPTTLLSEPHLHTALTSPPSQAPFIFNFKTSMCFPADVFYRKCKVLWSTGTF